MTHCQHEEAEHRAAQKLTRATNLLTAITTLLVAATVMLTAATWVEKTREDKVAPTPATTSS
jgi:hypothetical protein